MEKVLKAMRFAERAHRGQMRADGKTPYIQHPLAVAELVARWTFANGGEPNMVVGALLHDVIEDGRITVGTIPVEFGPVVCDIVEWATCTLKGEAKKKAQLETLK